MSSRSDPIALTRGLIAFNTINPSGDEQACIEYLGRQLQAGGFTVSYHEFERKRMNLIASWEGGGKAPLCFSGHIDTVPLGGMPWSKDPFGAEVDGDRVFGRGSSDMKGGVAAMAAAALRLAPFLPGKGGLKLIITVGEERACEGAKHLLRSGPGPGQVGALLVGEPTSNYPVVGHKGALWLEVRTTGITAHGSMPAEGANAIYRAARAALAIEKFDFNVDPHPILGSPTLNLGTISGGVNINSVPDQVAMGIDIRTVPGQSHDEISESLQALLGKEVILERLMDADCVWTDPEDPWVREVFEIMEPYLGEHPVQRGVTYFTDASFFTRALGYPPTLILGPGEAAMAHKTDEFCYLSKIEAATEAYCDIAKRWCAL